MLTTSPQASSGCGPSIEVISVQLTRGSVFIENSTNTARKRGGGGGQVYVLLTNDNRRILCSLEDPVVMVWSRKMSPLQEARGRILRWS